MTWNRLIATSGILLGLAAGLLSCGVSFVKGTAKVKLRGYQLVSGFSEGRAIIKSSKNLNLGYIDTKGRIVVPPRFRSADRFSGGLAPVDTGSRAGFGYIGLDGQSAIEPQFDSALPFSEGLAAVQRDGKWGYIDRTGALRIPYRYDDAFEFSAGRAKVVIEGFAGFIGTAGEEVVKASYHRAGAFSGGLACVCGRSLCGFVDRSGKLALALQFDDAGPFQEGLAPVRKGEKWGYIDKTGKLVIEPVFDEAAPFSEGLARVGAIKDSSYDGKFGGYSGRATFFGFIDTKGKRVFASSILGTEPFRGGITVVRVPSGGLCSDCYQYRLMTRAGDFLTGRYDMAKLLTDGLAAVSVGDTSYLVDRKGRPLIEFDHSYLSEPSHAARGRALLRYGYVDASGTAVLPHVYLSAQPFSEGLALVEERIDRSGRNQKFIDRSGDTVIDLPNSVAQALPFSGGLALFSVSTERFPKYGYMDRTGSTVIAPALASATPFFEGLAAVKQSRDLMAHDWGYIDAKGEFVIAPRFKGAGPFSNGLAYVEWVSNQRYLLSAVIDRTGKIVIDKPHIPALSHSLFGVPSLEQFKKLRNMTFGEGLIPKLDAGSSGWVDASNRSVIPGSRFSFLGLFSEGRAPVQMRDGGWGYIDAKGVLAVEPRHARAEPFSEGLGCVRDGAGRFAYVTPSGFPAIEPMWLEEAHPFHGGLALVKLNGRFGYLDKAGRFAIPPRYHRAESFSDGVAATALPVPRTKRGQKAQAVTP